VTHTSDALVHILDAHRFADLVGWSESSIFEAKGAQAYDLEAEAGRFELAKDTSAFANSGGGWLLIGLATQPAEAASTDVVTGLELIGCGAYPTAKLRGILDEYLFPRIVDLQVDWIALEPPDDRGILVICVPPQEPDLKPFVICKVVADGKRQKAILAGYAERIGADSTPLGPSRIQEVMRKGMSPLSDRISAVDQRLGLLLERTESPRAPDAAGADGEALLSERIRGILDD
jgi:hypothetical protein